ncbi:MAG: LytR/AlgR family response regulator transcription factor [Sphingobacterium sp.]
MPIIPVLIVEDFQKDAQDLKFLLSQIELDFEIDLAGTPKEAINKINANKYDIVFMDIVLGAHLETGMVDGMDLYESIDIKKRPQVIFVTAHDSFSLRSYTLDAADFISKPATYPMLCRALNNAFSRMAVPINIGYKPQPEAVYLELSDRICHRMEFSEIYYIQKVKGDNELAFFERNTAMDDDGRLRPRMAKKTIKEIINVLPDRGFVQVDQSTIVNIDFIASFYKGTIGMTEGPQHTFKVTRNYIKELRSKLHVFD